MSSIRSLISFFLILFLGQLHAQDRDIVESFLKKLKVEYPQFSLIYLNDNIQIKEFVITDRYVVLMDAKWGTKGRSGSYFYLFDRQSMVVQDTLIMQQVSPSFNNNLLVSEDRLFYRPKTGFLEEYTKKVFYDALTLSIPLEEGRFGSLGFHEDSGQASENMFLHFRDARNFIRSDTKKTVFYTINDKTQSYKFKDLADYSYAKRSLYKYLFPSTVTSKGLVLIDGVAGKLVTANQNKSEKSSIVLPKEFNESILNALLYDEQADRLYLRLVFKNDEKLYRLSGGEFRRLGINLPMAFSEVSIGIGYHRAMHIRDGKLYISLDIEEGGKSYDGLFVADL
ncbi:hypothetical protein [Roseivirga misakiensis]|nr:hypothetical protein [Roseivirga misakiensis]